MNVQVSWVEIQAALCLLAVKEKATRTSVLAAAVIAQIPQIEGSLSTFHDIISLRYNHLRRRHPKIMWASLVRSSTLMTLRGCGG